MQVASLVVVAFIGSVLWVVSPEAAAVYYGSELGWNPVLVGLTCACGQIGMYVLLYHGGEVLVARWRWLHDKVIAVRLRYQRRLERGYLLMTFTGSMTGIPPILALVVLAPGFGVPQRHLLPVTFAGRMVRFTVLAFAGEALLAWWRG